MTTGHVVLMAAFIHVPQTLSVSISRGDEILELVDIADREVFRETVALENPAVVDEKAAETVDADLPTPEIPVVSDVPTQVWKKKEPPEQVSYGEFVKKYGKKPAARPQKVSAQTRKMSSPIDYPKPTLSISKLSVANPGKAATSVVNDELSRYVALVLSHIEKAWKAQNIPVFGRRQATVVFNVNAMGQVTSHQIVQSSSDTQFDHIVSLLFQQLPLLPPPQNVARSFRLTFEQGGE